ncbi:MAG: ABC transporter ATP-binding protein [Alphaproteobacteria bacterium]|nr:ABC transporter ATP-binding protein [Alphaproteobacteria bacterium]
MLDVERLEVRYGRLPAVRDISINVAAGEIVCVVGPNGAGKSTTMLAIAGELTPSRGRLLFEGGPLAGRSSEDTARLGISLVPEGRRIFGTLTVEENLRVASYIRRDRDAAAKDLESLLDRFPILKERFRSPAGRLSGGEQQILAIARGMLTRPKLMLVDEPSLGLAPKNVDLVYELLRSLREAGMTLLIVEQNLDRVMDVADRVYVMRDGRVQLSGTVVALKGSAELEAAYFGFDRGAA